MKRLEITVELDGSGVPGLDDHPTAEDILEFVGSIQWTRAGKVVDINGNTVGSFKVADRHETHEGMLEWVAQTVHQGYHTDHTGTWRQCPKSICASIRSHLTEE